MMIIIIITITIALKIITIINNFIKLFSKYKIQI